MHVGDEIGSTGPNRDIVYQILHPPTATWLHDSQQINSLRWRSNHDDTLFLAKGKTAVQPYRLGEWSKRSLIAWVVTFNVSYFVFHALLVYWRLELEETVQHKMEMLNELLSLLLHEVDGNVNIVGECQSFIG
ncbi:hypothetical protein CEXT_716701 [Caerostris extrusa]|uniref:Uncharacterized protein n=1 Tax=Caerostris extrusa TaxID=172846 RepID=A0AAV4RKI7_CAEEX|nr:hypothetical protein CEXT_716701 [Caerostris extrusa]